MTDSVHDDPFRLGDEYVYDQQFDPDLDEWQQLHASLRHDIAYRKHMRDAQVDGDDLYATYQTEITTMTRQLLALEANFDQLRDAQAAVSRARARRAECLGAYRAFGARCTKVRNAAGVVGAVALILCCTLDDVPGFVIVLAVFGPLAAAALHALSVLGGSGRAAEADRADTAVRTRSAELDHLRTQVMGGVRNPQPRSADQAAVRHAPAPSSAAVSLFPK